MGLVTRGLGGGNIATSGLGGYSFVLPPAPTRDRSDGMLIRPGLVPLDDNEVLVRLGGVRILAVQDVTAGDDDGAVVLGIRVDTTIGESSPSDSSTRNVSSSPTRQPPATVQHASNPNTNRQDP